MDAMYSISDTVKYVYCNEVTLRKSRINFQKLLCNL
jgi:hypothetical protein